MSSAPGSASCRLHPCAPLAGPTCTRKAMPRPAHLGQGRSHPGLLSVEAGWDTEGAVARTGASGWTPFPSPSRATAASGGNARSPRSPMASHLKSPVSTIPWVTLGPKPYSSPGSPEQVVEVRGFPGWPCCAGSAGFRGCECQGHRGPPQMPAHVLSPWGLQHPTVLLGSPETRATQCSGPRLFVPASPPRRASSPFLLLGLGSRGHPDPQGACARGSGE